MTTDGRPPRGVSHTQLRAFHAVATQGGFTRAAAALGLTQPTLSGQVRALEDSYGVRLFDRLDGEVQDELLAHAKLLEEFGPTLGRPRVDTLKGSRHANMKELRFEATGIVWRVAFAFDPRRRAVVLVAGDKAGVNERRFYKALIRRADERFDSWLARMKGSR